MRLTVNLEEGIYRMAKAFALSENISINKAINIILQRASSGERLKSPGKDQPLSDFPVSKGSRSFTSEDVYKAEEDEDFRHWSAGPKSSS